MQTLKKVINSKYVELLLILLILILGFGVRLWKIKTPIADWHSWRQVDTASVTKIYVQNGINLLKPQYYDISKSQTGYFNPEGLRLVEFPIYNVIHALLVKSFPVFPIEVWGRLVSISCAVLSGLFMYLIGKRFLGKWGGLLSAFFFLFIPYNIYFTRVILPEPMVITLALASLWFFVLFLERDKFLFLIFSGIFFALSTLLKPFTFFYALTFLYLAVDKYGLKKMLNDLRFYLFAAIAMIPFFAWRIYINQFMEGIPHFDWAFNSDHIRFRPAFWRWLFGERIGRLILGIWGMVPFAFGVVKAEKKNLFAHFLLLSGILYMTVLATANVRHDYYQVFLIPPISFLLAIGTKYLWEEKNLNLYLSRGVLGLSLFLMFGMGTYQVKEYYKINHPEIIEAGKAVERLTPKDARVIAPYNADTAFLYQTGRFGWPIVDNSFDYLISKGADYYVSVNLGDADTQYVSHRFKTIEKTDQYIIMDLHQELPGFKEEIKK